MAAEPIRTLVAEPRAVLATMIMRCLRVPDVSATHTEHVDAAALVAAATHDRAQVMLAGPGVAHATLLGAIPKLLAAGTRTVVLSDRRLDDRSSMLLLAGASGFLVLDDTSTDAVVDAVRVVAAGQSALHPGVVHAVLDRWRAARDGGPGPAAGDAPELTAREREVLAGLRDGLTNRQLANRLGVAEKTVETHKSRLYNKLGARNQAHAVRIAQERNLLG